MSIDPNSYAAVSANFMGRSYEIPLVQATAPHLSEYGFQLRDDSVGDYSFSISSGVEVADLSGWHLPLTTTQLRIDESRWDNELYVVQPGKDPFDITKGSMQGVWTGGSGGTAFTSFHYYDASSQAHPDLIWLLWDATRNEYFDPDPGTSGDFFLAYDGTDTDGDGLPDWWERRNQLNPNDPTDGGGSDFDGDGYLDSDEFANHVNPREKDNPILQLSVTGFVTP